MPRDYKIDLVVHRQKDVNGCLAFESSKKHMRVFASSQEDAIHMACFRAKEHERELWNRVKVEVISVE